MRSRRGPASVMPLLQWTTARRRGITCKEQSVEAGRAGRRKLRYAQDLDLDRMVLNDGGRGAGSARTHGIVSSGNYIPWNVHEVE